MFPGEPRARRDPPPTCCGPARPAAPARSSARWMITYVDKIVDMRRNLVMVRGGVPGRAGPAPVHGARDQRQPVEHKQTTPPGPRRVVGGPRRAADGRRARETPTCSSGWAARRATTTARRRSARAMVRAPQARGRALRDPGQRGDLHGRPGAPRRQRAPLPDAGRAERRDAQQAQPEEDRHDLPPLLQHAAQRVPQLRREVRGRAPHRLPPGAARPRRAAHAHEGASEGEGGGGLPRLVLPGALQRRVRAAARDPPSASRGVELVEAEWSRREGPLLRRRRRADVDGGAARPRAREQAPHAAAPRHQGASVVASVPLLPDDAHRRHQRGAWATS